MASNSEITLEIRDDILKFLQAKVTKYGYTLEELVNYFLTEVVRTKKLPCDMDDLKVLPPIVSVDELSDQFEENVNRMLSVNDVVYISHACEIAYVIMRFDKYEALLSADKSKDGDNLEDKQNES